MNYATKWLAKAAKASLAAWDDEEHSVQQEHHKMIEDLRDAIFYFDAHGESQKEDRD